MRAGRLLVIAGVGIPAVVAVLVLTGAFQSDAETTDFLPDLEQAAPYDLSGRTGGTAAEPRFFLGFASAAGNLGDGPLVVLGSRATTEEPEMRLVQRVSRSDGSTRTTPVDAALSYVRSFTHSHWHLIGFMRYELRAAKGGRLLRDNKTGFCLGDRYKTTLAVPRAELSGRFTDECGKNRPELLRLREGISVGWGDDYDPHLEGQEFDVTTLPAGRYVLVHRVNAGAPAARKRLRQQRRVDRLRPRLASRPEADRRRSTSSPAAPAPPPAGRGAPEASSADQECEAASRGWRCAAGRE